MQIVRLGGSVRIAVENGTPLFLPVPVGVNAHIAVGTYSRKSLMICRQHTLKLLRSGRTEIIRYFQLRLRSLPIVRFGGSVRIEKLRKRNIEQKRNAQFLAYRELCIFVNKYF